MGLVVKHLVYDAPKGPGPFGEAGKRGPIVLTIEVPATWVKAEGKASNPPSADESTPGDPNLG